MVQESNPPVPMSTEDLPRPEEAPCCPPRKPNTEEK